MSISTFWIVMPFAVSLPLTLLWWCYSPKQDKKEKEKTKDVEKGFLDGYCPPEEVPIISIRPQYGRVTKAGLFQVAFATTGKDTFYWLTASEIVTRCRRHNQKIPFIVACDKGISLKGKKSLALGDDLLEKKK